MNKQRIVISVLLLALLLSACGTQPEAGGQSAPAEQTTVNTPAPAPFEEPARAASSGAYDAVDVDLTLLSSTMVYSEVFNMVYEPESYEGKTVKMTGLLSAYEADGKLYLACIVPDATACCAQGLEFELKDSYSYPDDFPENGSEITVAGTFTSYTEEVGGGSYVFFDAKGRGTSLIKSIIPYGSSRRTFYSLRFQVDDRTINVLDKRCFL